MTTSRTLFALGFVALIIGLALGKGQGEAHSASNIASMVLLPVGVLTLVAAGVMSLIRRRVARRTATGHSTFRRTWSDR